MISLRNVSKSYGKQEVLKGFTLEIEDGARVALMGRSGAGKSTVLNLIMGLQKPDNGSISGTKLKIGAVFQEDRLIESLSAISNCKLVMKSGGPDGMLERLGITDELSKKRVSELSGGERRRVAIARALLSEPDAIILDEPFKGIDAETLPKVIYEVNKAAEGKTVLLVTHSQSEAEALGCRIVKM